MWSAACAGETTGVLHTDAVRHLDARSASTRPNFGAKAVAEAVVLFDRLAAGTAGAVVPLARGPDEATPSPRVAAQPQTPRALAELTVGAQLPAPAG